MDVTGSTFCGNSVLGFGLVEIFSYQENVVASGNGGSASGNQTCSFLAVSETIPEEDRQVTCVDFDAGGCEEVPETMEPTTAPPNATLYPTPSPSSVKDHPSPKAHKMKMMGMYAKGMGSSSMSTSKSGEKSSSSKGMLSSKGASMSGTGSADSTAKGDPKGKGMGAIMMMKMMMKGSSAKSKGASSKGSSSMSKMEMKMRKMMGKHYETK